MSSANINKYACGVLALSALLASALYRAIREDLLGQYIPIKPVVLQFPINDICNSHCVMCNVWRRKLDRELTADELHTILTDPLFNEIRYVGISGGEPTLRADLPAIGHVLIESLPKLSGASIITNAIRPKQVIERIVALAQVFSENNVPFSVSVSLDGIGDTHDRHRGVKGNFQAATEVIESLRRHGVSVSIGCTLTPFNCFEADDVLLWCFENSIEHWEFRLGVDVKRLYNDGFTTAHPFSQEQRFHLSLFFDKLAHDPRVNKIDRRTYCSLSDQLAFGAKRSADCDWKNRGVTLDARGDISYCSTYSPILGSALQNSAWDIYKRNLRIRRRIRQTFCANCQHLGGEPQAIEAVCEQLKKFRTQLEYISRLLPIVRQKKIQTARSVHPADRSSPPEWRHVLITGWYGTETAGDKAILGELIHFLNTHASGCKITLTTLDRKVTNHTRLELNGLESAKIVDMDKAHDPKLIKEVDAIIIGGGPLMETEPMEYIRRMFSEANRQCKARIIFGCGLGPLYTDRFRRITSEICRLATGGFLRDEESREYALTLGGNTGLLSGCDPALAYLFRWAASIQFSIELPHKPILATLMRANTSEYVRLVNTSELDEQNSIRAQSIARIIDSFCKECGATVNLLPMHSLYIGGDDRLFNRKIANFLNNSTDIYVERRYLPLSMLLESISKANIAIAMRYHSHLFCMALGIPFLSIDYSGPGGKVHNLIKRVDYGQLAEDWHTIDEQRASSKLRELYKTRSKWSAYLKTESRKLVSQLTQTYNKVFELQ